MQLQEMKPFHKVLTGNIYSFESVFCCKRGIVRTGGARIPFTTMFVDGIFA